MIKEAEDEKQEGRANGIVLTCCMFVINIWRRNGVVVRFSHTLCNIVTNATIYLPLLQC